MTPKRQNTPRPVMDAFWAIVTDPELPAEGPCLEWPGSRNKHGYGMTKRMGENFASRSVWVAVNGPIPAGMLICHRCDNPPCCRIGHLFVGDHKANSDDKIQKGRDRHAAGEQSGMATISADTVVEMRTRHAAGETAEELGTSYGVNPATVSRICRGLARKRDGGPIRREPLRRRAPLKARSPLKRKSRELTRAASEEKAARALARRQQLDERTNEMRRLYLDEGLSTTEVGALLGVDASRVSIHLRRAGVQMRPRKRQPRQVDGQELRRSYEAGASIPELARENGKSTNDITRALKEAGVAIRRAGRPKWSADESSSRRVLYRRSGKVCEGCGNGVAGEAHHRKNRSQGGRWEIANLLHLCGECHRWVTGHPAEGRKRGWAVKSFEDPAEIPVLLHLQTWVIPGDGVWIPSEAPEDLAA